MAGPPDEVPWYEDRRSYTVETTAIGRPAGRSGWVLRFGAVGVAGIVGLAVLGRLGVVGPPPIPERPPAAVATAAPQTAEPRHTDDQQTDNTAPIFGPGVVPGTGPRPNHPIPVLHFGFNPFDPVSGGSRGTGLAGRAYDVLTDQGGRLVCLCAEQPAAPPDGALLLQVRRFDPATGEATPAHDPIRLVAAAPGGVGLDGSLSADGERVAVFSVGYRDGAWQLEVTTARVADGEHLGTLAVAALPAVWLDGWPDGTPPGRRSTALTDRVDVANPTIDWWPDERTADLRLDAWLPNRSQGPAKRHVRLAWRVAIDGGGRPVDVGAAAFDPRGAGDCPAEGSATAAVRIRVCEATSGGGGAIQQLIAEAADGTAMGSTPLGFRAGQGTLDALADRTTGRAFVWLPAEHTLHRFDATTLEVATTTIDDAVLDAVPALPGIDPTAGGAPVDWRRLASPSMGAPHSLVGSPDGRYLYALGGWGGGTSGFGGPPRAPGERAATGIWVFDATSLALVDHWPRASSYTSIGLLEGGRFVAAVGGNRELPGGRVLPWSESIAVHDAVTGALAMTYSRASAAPIRLIDPAR